MSQDDRLLGDTAALRFELEAITALSAAPLLSSVTESLAVSVIALARDRRARMEVAEEVWR